MKKYILLAASILLLFSGTFAHAQTASTTCPGGGTPNANGSCNLGYTQLEPIPGLTAQTGTSLVDPNNLHNIINAVFKIIITVGALIAVLSLTLGGVQYMVSGSAGGKNAGMKRAQAALWAILLIAASWLILNTINPALLNFSLNPCPQGGTTCTITSSASNITPPAQTGITSAGTVPNIQAPDGNAAITRAQNTPSTAVTPEILQAANADLQQNQTYCTDTLGGTVGNGEVTGSGCAGDLSQHIYGSKTYTGCANIPTPSGNIQSCYYNK